MQIGAHTERRFNTHQIGARCYMVSVHAYDFLNGNNAYSLFLNRFFAKIGFGPFQWSDFIKFGFKLTAKEQTKIPEKMIPFGWKTKKCQISKDETEKRALFSRRLSFEDGDSFALNVSIQWINSNEFKPRHFARHEWIRSLFTRSFRGWSSLWKQP